MDRQATAFGDRVRKRREAEGLTQDELAKEVGISRYYLGQIERGKVKNFSLEVARRLSNKLGLPMSEALDADDTLPGTIPDSLRQFAEESNVAPQDIAMLARIEYRGHQPQTPEQWHVLYTTIKAMTGNG